MLSIEGVGLRLGSLDLEVSLDVPAAGCTAVVGPSGGGKTSLLRSIAGLARPHHGRISCFGATWLDAGAGLSRPPERRACAYVFQDYALFPHLSAWRNVAYSMRGARRADRRGRALELLGSFGIADLADARPRTLSGGERQRVALARALALEPAALLLDEPLSALDARTRAGARGELAGAIARAGVPTILVTHDFEEAVTLADRVAVLSGGRIVERGSPGKLASRPGSAFVADLVGSVVLGGRAETAAGSTRVALDGGGEVYTTDGCAPGPVALSVHPWDVALEPAGSEPRGSARNRLAARVVSVTPLGSRVRVGLDAGQPLVAELTPASTAELGLEPGRQVVAVWKASATRVVSS